MCSMRQTRPGTMRLLLSPGADVAIVRFEMPQAANATTGAGGSLALRLGPSRNDPQLFYPVPVAFQDGASGRIDQHCANELSATHALPSGATAVRRIQSVSGPPR